MAARTMLLADGELACMLSAVGQHAAGGAAALASSLHVPAPACRHAKNINSDVWPAAAAAALDLAAGAPVQQLLHRECRHAAAPAQGAWSCTAMSAASSILGSHKWLQLPAGCCIMCMMSFTGWGGA